MDKFNFIFRKKYSATLIGIFSILVLSFADLLTPHAANAILGITVAFVGMQGYVDGKQND